MAWSEFQGHRVWYERQGSGDPVVFLPNATLDGRLWEHQAGRFKDQYDVIVVDLPGFGRSDRLTPSLGLWVRWLGRFVDEMQLAPVALAGNCMGSLTALTYAADHPAKVNALVLFNTLDKDVGAAGPMGAGTGMLRARAFRPVIEAMVRHGPSWVWQRHPGPLAAPPPPTHSCSSGPPSIPGRKSTRRTPSGSSPTSRPDSRWCAWATPRTRASCPTPARSPGCRRCAGSGARPTGCCHWRSAGGSWTCFSPRKCT